MITNIHSWSLGSTPNKSPVTSGLFICSHSPGGPVLENLTFPADPFAFCIRTSVPLCLCASVPLCLCGSKDHVFHGNFRHFPEHFRVFPRAEKIFHSPISQLFFFLNAK